MKKILLCGALCALSISFLGCEMEVPTEEVGSFTFEEFCTLTGGNYIPDINKVEDENKKITTSKILQRCRCGTDICGEGVTCVINDTQTGLKCMGAESNDLPQLLCTEKGKTICYDRVAGTALTGFTPSGYFVECDGSNWSEPKQCPNGYSCKPNLINNLYYSTECGECTNDGKDCVSGTLVQN